MGFEVDLGRRRTLSRDDGRTRSVEWRLLYGREAGIVLERAIRLPFPAGFRSTTESLDEENLDSRDVFALDTLGGDD